jgi:hypothetical protein
MQYNTMMQWRMKSYQNGKFTGKYDSFTEIKKIDKAHPQCIDTLSFFGYNPYKHRGD